jgi:trehalose 6-phosphate phosphatase
MYSVAGVTVNRTGTVAASRSGQSGSGIADKRRAKTFTQPEGSVTSTVPVHNNDVPATAACPHANQKVPKWVEQWRDAGRLILLLDFDGTLAPIVPRPESAAILPEARTALLRLLELGNVDIAIVSGRGLSDARRMVGLTTVAYAGNHGMEIDGPGVHQIHEQAAAARPVLDHIVERLRAPLGEIEGAILEDKGLTLTIHYRLVDDSQAANVRQLVKEATVDHPEIRVTEGKMVLEVRPAVEWDKGRAVAFLLDHLRPASDVPVIYIGDDATDEDAFRALRKREGPGEGIIVADPPRATTLARSFLRWPEEVAELLHGLAASQRGPSNGP